MRIKLVIFLSLLLVVVIAGRNAFAGPAKIKTIPISKGKVVVENVIIEPGNAAIIEFPSDIIAPIPIPDRSIFSCDRKIPSYNSIICRPIKDTGLSTTAIVTTEFNEFILTLSSSSGEENSFVKYKFLDHSQSSNKIQDSFDRLESDRTHGMIDMLLNDFGFKKCKSRSTSMDLKMTCNDIIQIGTEKFLRFTLSSKYKSKIDILSCNAVLQTFGGFTGLTLKNEKPENAQFKLTQNSLRFGEEVQGIIKIPNVSVQDNQRLSVKITTDVGDIEISESSYD